MNFKRNLTVAAVAALLAVPAFSLTNVNASMTLKDIPQTSSKAEVYGPAIHQHVRYNGHVFIASPNGTITNLDGQNNPSDAQIKGALGEKTSESNQTSSSNESDSSSDQSSSNDSSNSEYQNQNTNHGKLVQTGEHSTARKAGIAAVVIALVAFVVVKVRKVAKRN